MTAVAAAGPLSTVPCVTVALVGRQNAGKTSLLMHLTGRTQHPVNFPGSSVERGEAEVEVDGVTLRVVDLPGLASLTPSSPDEEIALAYLAGDVPAEARPDVVCAVADASKLSVELGVIAQLIAGPVPVVLALNKVDLAAAAGRPVDVERLADRLGIPVVATHALKGEGAADLTRVLLRTAQLPARRARLALSPAQIAAEVQPPEPSGGPRRSLTDRVDAVLLHRVFGLPLLLLVMFGMFQALFTVAGPFMDLIETAQGALVASVEGAIEAGALQRFVVDGLINGVGSVVIFLPQIALLMLIVALLEGSGYMARAAFLLDRPLRKVGLSGRSFVPMVSSFACAVPGIMSSRIISNERERIATIVVAPLMSCSARLPVYVLLIGAFFPASAGGAVLLSMYLLGIVVAAAVALLLRKTVLAGPTSHLMMELPVYQRPSTRVVWAQVWAGCRDFMVLAGTVIFAAAVIIWLLSYYPRPVEIHDAHQAQRDAVTAQYAGAEAEARISSLDAAEAAAYMEQSALSTLGRAFHPIFEPAGWGDWRTTVGVMASFPARELIIPTLGILYSHGEVDPGDFEVASLGEADTGQGGLRASLRQARGPDGELLFSPLVALSIMVFFALCSQCAATLATIRRETRSWRWPIFTFAYMTALAWLGAVLVFQIGRLVS